MKDKYESKRGCRSSSSSIRPGGHTYWPGIMDEYPAVWEWFDKYLVRQ